MTAVEWLENEIDGLDTAISYDYFKEKIQQALELEKQQAKDYAIFAVNCDRKQLPVLDFDDYIFLYKI